jgi:spermidine synthase
MAAVFLIAYACSGAAGLMYEVGWTRLMTLGLGHTTVAATTVVAAFMGGLAGGSLVAGRIAPNLTRRQSLRVYVALELIVALTALILPYELKALTPMLRWSYGDSPGALFAAVRLVSCLTLLLIPAFALGGTFPLAVRWFVTRDDHPGRTTGALYAANTAGAALGALSAGFLLIPAMGVGGTTMVGVAAGVAAVIGGVLLLRSPEVINGARSEHRAGRKDTGTRTSAIGPVRTDTAPRLATLALGASGFAALTYEIAWTRTLSAVVGPTTYAFSGMLATVIAGTACGSAAGSWLATRTRHPAFWLAIMLASAGGAAAWVSGLIGTYVPRLVAHELARSAAEFNQSLPRHTLNAALLMLPAAAFLGAAFPLALELIGARGQTAARPFSVVYAVNTLAAVAGTFAAGFVMIPRIGLQQTLSAVSLGLVITAVLVLVLVRLPSARRVAGVAWVTVAVALLVSSPKWDRELLAGGVYKYAPYVDPELDLESALKAGTLLYYREGAASTVSVKRLTGALSLAIDGKVDASNGADMVTQKLLAHLPLMLHRDPHDIGIIGLGSGVTLGSALVHPIARADVVEISPEVIEASRYFAHDNRDALRDRRVNLIVGDGRSHMLLSSRKYDVIISEPSNPWMSGVAALFTREFFLAVRGRLQPDGIVCQWAHTYDMTDGDLRSIVATFSSVFPNATLWLIGGDVMLVASNAVSPLQLGALDHGWRRPGVADDLRIVSVLDAFGLLSSYVAGPEEISRYAAGAVIQNDDRMALEFSGPQAVAGKASIDNAGNLRQLFVEGTAPAAVQHARAAAGAVEWRNRGAMMTTVTDYRAAFEAYSRAFELDADDTLSLDGLVRAAVAAHRDKAALQLLQSSIAAHPRAAALRIAASRLLATTGAMDEAIAAAKEACRLDPGDRVALEQLASLYADFGDPVQLTTVVRELERINPDGRGSHYYAAAASFLKGELDAAVQHAQRAIGAAPQDAPAQNLLGAIQATRGDTMKARAAFENALRLDPRDTATYVNLGLLELSSGNRTRAAAYFDEALSLDPKSAAARQGLAQSR